MYKNRYRARTEDYGIELFDRKEGKVIKLNKSSSKAFLKINKLAGYLLIPYLAWVSFAGILNLSIWYLNQ